MSTDVRAQVRGAPAWGRAGDPWAPKGGRMVETGLTKQQTIQMLTRSPHGDLNEYTDTMRAAVREDPEFAAHLISWNRLNGQIRDAKVALPTISLAGRYPDELTENSHAHLALLDPRNLVRAVRFSKELNGDGGQKAAIRRTVVAYIRAREERWPWWERTALAHRASMKTLYAMLHIKPSAAAQLVLFRRTWPVGSIFHAVANLSKMSPAEAAGTIIEKRIPFLVASGALGAKAKDPMLVMALIERMSPTQLVTNTKALERLGVMTDPALRAAFEEGLQRAATSKKTTLKATKAAGAVAGKKLHAKLQALQEKQLDSLGGIEGDWLILGDKSASMEQSIETTRHLAAVLAKMVKGKIHVVFFDSTPRYFDATGMSYEDLVKRTSLVKASGATSVGCGLQYAMERGLGMDGIAIISDAKENTLPYFAAVYARLETALGKRPPVYLYRMATTYSGWGDMNLGDSAKRAGIDLQEFDLRDGVDYYSLPNIAKTMRANRYALTDEIMEAPLLTMEQALKPEAMGRA